MRTHRADSVGQGAGVEVGDAAAWFAVAVALIAAFIALGNANSAKTQAGAALKQAGEAEKTRKAAEEQVAEARRAAQAAEAQGEIMAKQHETELAARDESDGPQFSLTVLQRDGNTHPIEVEMGSGPESIRVQALCFVEFSAPSPDRENFVRTPVGNRERNMVRGSTLVLDIEVPNPRETVIAVIHLACRELAGKGREWTRMYSCTLEPPVEPWVSYG